MGKGKFRSFNKSSKSKTKGKKKGKKKVDLEDLHHALQIQKIEKKEALERGDKRKGKKRNMKEKPARSQKPAASEAPQPEKEEEEDAPLPTAYNCLLGSLGVESQESSDEEMGDGGERSYEDEMLEEMGEVLVSDEEGMEPEELEEGEDEAPIDPEDQEARDVAADLMEASESDEEASADEEEPAPAPSSFNLFRSFEKKLTEDDKKIRDKWIPSEIPGWRVASTVPVTGISQPSSLADLPAAYNTEPKLATNWAKIMGDHEMDPEEFAKHNGLFGSLNSYRDILFPAMDHTNATMVRALYALHAVNHVLRARRRVTKNSDKIKAAADRPERLAELEDSPDLQDQGFTRPRVVIVAPFRSVAHELVQMIEKLCPGEVMNRKRFEEEFGPDEEGHGRNPKYMTADWLHLFDGNYDDKFRIGISFARKQMKLYSPFFASDIIICSPLGLRLITGVEGDAKREVDFLSSVEMLIVDRADALRMQNWDHFMEILAVMNRKPKEMRDIDIRRIRPANAAGDARFLRQTVVLSDGANADYSNILVDLVKHDDRKQKDKDAKVDSDEEEDVTMFDIRSFEATNYRGRQKFLLTYPCNLKTPMARQMFLHCPCSKIASRHKSMYDLFVNKFWPDVGQGLDQLLIFVPSYGDFLKVRRFFKDESVNFVSLSEYSGNSELSIKRKKFQQGEANVMVITERLAWFRRYRMRGTKHVVFFGPPETPIYNEVLGWIEQPSQASSVTLFTPFDAMQLERVVGSARTKTLVTSSPNKLFCYT